MFFHGMLNIVLCVVNKALFIHSLILCICFRPKSQLIPLPPYLLTGDHKLLLCVCEPVSIL